MDWTLKRAEGFSRLGFRASSYLTDETWPTRSFMHDLFSGLCKTSVPELDIWLQGLLSEVYFVFKIAFCHLPCCGQAEQTHWAGPGVKPSRTVVQTSLPRASLQFKQHGKMISSLSHLTCLQLYGNYSQLPWAFTSSHKLQTLSLNHSCFPPFALPSRIWPSCLSRSVQHATQFSTCRSTMR